MSRRKVIQVQFIADFACPWCYVGKVRLVNAIEQFKIENPEVQVRVCFSPFLIDSTTPAEGEDYMEYNARRWGGDDWTHSVRSSSVTDGVGFANWKTWPNSMLAHRLQKFSEGYDRGNEVNGLIFDTIYERGGNVSDLETLVSIAEEAGLPGAATRRYLMSREGVDAIISEDLHAKNALNITNAPHYVLRGASPSPGGGTAHVTTGRAIVIQGPVSSLNIVQALWSAPSR